MNLRITWTERWMETRCGHCPTFSIQRVAALGPLNGIRRAWLWRYHKHTFAHVINRSASTT